MNVDRRGQLFVTLALLALLAGCGSAPRRPAAGPDLSAPQSQPSRPGGYYQDDGPGESPPAGVDNVEDAHPRVEPLSRSANSPYTVFGTHYVPAKALAPFKQRGVASWYGRKFHGQRTSSGERYDMYKMTAAHPTLPIPSYARVTRLRTGKSVIVRINDRGPFHPGRVIDLSYAAAAKLGFVKSGSTRVEVEAILPEDMPAIAAQRRAPPAAGPVAVAQGPGATDPTAPALSADPARPIAPDPIPVAGDAAGVYLQLAAFSARENAESLRAKLQPQLSWLDQRIQILYREGLYRLHLGPYRDRAEASGIAARIRDSLELRPVIIVR